VADTRIEQGIAEKFGPAPPPTTEGRGGGREEGATKRPVYTLEDKVCCIAFCVAVAGAVICA